MKKLRKENFLSKDGLFSLRISSQNGEILFDAETVAKSLGLVGVSTKTGGKKYEWVRWDRVNEYLKFAQDIGKGDFIPEPAVYKLAFKANNDVAEKFQDWLAVEVLPQIRQTGGYIPTNKDETEEDILAKAILIAQKTIEKKNKLIEEQKPLVSFANKVATSQNSLLVREVAKLASKEGIAIGEKRLWQKLRNWNLIFKDSTEPKQYGIDRGYFEVVEGARESSKGTFTYKTTRVTGKGQIYIISRLEKELSKQEVACN